MDTAELEKKDYRPKAVCAAARLDDGTRKTWIKREEQRRRAGLPALDFPTGAGDGREWGTYSFARMLRVVAFAEVNRLGIAPSEGRGLVDKIERAMRGIARKERAPRFVVAQIWERGEGVRMRVSDKLDRNALFDFFSRQQDAGLWDADVASVVVVDCVRLWQTTLNELVKHLTEAGK